MTILRRPIKRELPERNAHRQMVVEPHPGFVRLREKHSRTAWGIDVEAIKAAASEQSKSTRTKEKRVEKPKKE